MSARIVNMRFSKNQRRLIDLGFELLEQQKSQDNETTELPKDVSSLYKEMRLALFPEAPKQPKQPQAEPFDPIKVLLRN